MEELSRKPFFSVALLVIAVGVVTILAFTIVFARMPKYPDSDTLVKQKLDAYFDKINA